MPTATKRAGKTKKITPQKDAIDLLKADHKVVNTLFKEYATARAPKKRVIIAQICKELTIHAQIEEEIFYPRAQSAIKDKALIPEAVVEHQTLKYLIAQIMDAPSDELFAARVTVLAEYVKHHVKEEQNELFPLVKKSKLDLVALGDELLMRKEELQADFG